MKQPVTPYLWRYQPETGRAAGARQDYGAVPNWFSSSPFLYGRIADVNAERNRLERIRGADGHQRATAAEIGGAMKGTGGAYALGDGRSYRKITRDALPFPHGYQVFEDGRWKPVPQPSAAMKGAVGAMRGAGAYALGDGRSYRKITRDALPFPHGYQVFEDGYWKPVPVDPSDPPASMNGEGANALSSYPTLVYEETSSRLFRYRNPGAQVNAYAERRAEMGGSGVSERFGSAAPHGGGMSPLRFAQQFPPVVYDRPFSEPVQYFPKEFDPLFEPKNDPRGTSLYTLQYARPRFVRGRRP